MKLPHVLHLVITLLFLVVAATAYAEVSVSGIHRLVHAEPAGEGSSLGFRLKVANTGSDALAATRLIAKDPLVVPGSPGSEISIPGLAAGDSVTIDVTVLSALPADQLREGIELPLNFEALLTDTTGSVRSLTLVSEGGTP
jgi:hypothetical protein